MTIKSFNVEKRSQYLSIKIGNKKDAKNMGGFNLFGKKFGDYEQDLVLTLVYHHVSPL
jgi:predicted transcriptional regulator